MARRTNDWVVSLQRILGIQQRRSVLFEVYNSFGFDAQEPVILQLAKRGRVTVHVSGAAERGVTAHRIETLARAGVQLHPLRASRHRLFDSIVITDGRLVNSWRSSKYVFLHHGSAFGNRPLSYATEMLESGDVDYLLAINHAEARSAHTHFGRRLQGRVEVVGQPKLDRLVNSTKSSRRFLESLGLDAGRRTILFLSHWTPLSLMHTWADEVLGSLRNLPEFNVLVTGHPHLWDHPARSGGVDWQARLGWIALEKHMRLLPDPEDPFELMTAADIAITDHTSATMEYALLNRPIVLFRHPDFVFFDHELDECLRSTSSVFSNISEFPAAFEQAVNGASIDQEARRALIESCFSHLGNSSLQAAIAIEQIAETGILPDSESDGT